MLFNIPNPPLWQYDNKFFVVVENLLSFENKFYNWSNLPILYGNSEIGAHVKGAISVIWSVRAYE